MATGNKMSIAELSSYISVSHSPLPSPAADMGHPYWKKGGVQLQREEHGGEMWRNEGSRNATLILPASECLLLSPLSAPLLDKKNQTFFVSSLRRHCSQMDPSSATSSQGNFSHCALPLFLPLSVSLLVIAAAFLFFLLFFSPFSSFSSPGGKPVIFVLQRTALLLNRASQASAGWRRQPCTPSPAPILTSGRGIFFFLHVI